MTNFTTSIRWQMPVHIAAAILLAAVATLPPLVPELTAQANSDDRWDRSFGWNGVVGNVLAIDAGDCNMYVGGDFGSETSDNYIARFDGSGFSRLGNESIDGRVHAIAVDGSEVYIGGNFSSIGELQAPGIARWNGIAWEEISGGVAGGSATVHDIALFGSDVFIAGDFTSVDGTDALNIARWNGLTGTWSPIGPGVEGVVYDLHVQGDWLYVGGKFASAGGISTSNIVRFNLINSTWQRLGNGLNDTVQAIAVTDRYVYATGDFTHSSLVELNHIGRFDRATSDWTSLAGGATAPGYDLLLDGEDLYAVGAFTEIGGIATTGAALWNGSEWEGLESGLDGPARAIAACAERICVGGSFQKAGSVDSPFLASWEEDSWRSLAPGRNNGLNHPSRAVAFLPDSETGEFYAAGEFTMAGSLPVNHIAFWNGSQWESVGSGVDGPVHALATDGDVVVVGGSFERSSDIPLGNIGLWNRTTQNWEALGSGDGLDGPVYAILIDGDMVYVGGDFSSADGTPAANLARYTMGTGAWGGIGNGTDGPVHALALEGGTLHVGGDFSEAGGSTSGNYATFDLAGDSWERLSPGMNGPVRAIAISDDGAVYVGGDFTRIATAAYDRLTEHVAINDGTEWRALEGGLAEGVRITTVYDIATEAESVFFGGEFTLAGGVPIGYLARWRESWVPLGSGIDGILPVVYDIDAANEMVSVAGSFSRAGSTPSVNIALWDDRAGGLGVPDRRGIRPDFRLLTGTTPEELSVTIIPGSRFGAGRIGLTSVTGEEMITPIEVTIGSEPVTVTFSLRSIPAGPAILRIEAGGSVSGQVIVTGR